MKQYKGTYLGMSPTDESAIGLGEIEIEITDTYVKLCMAGGLRLEEVQWNLNDFEQMSPEEVAPQYPNEAGQMFVGFKHKECKSVEFLLCKKPRFRDFDLMLRGGLGDCLGPTLLWNKKRFLHFAVVKMYLRMCDIRTKGGIPLLKRGGLTK